MSCFEKDGICPIDDLGHCCHKHNRALKVVAVIPVQGRLPLLKHTIERLYKKNGVFKVVCVGDGHQERKVCELAGAEWVHHKNKPLGQKWNKGFEYAKRFSPDACLFVGSSDWLSDNWLAEMGPYILKYDLVGTAGCYFLDVGSSFRVCYWPGYEGKRIGESIGIGRLISSKVLDKLKWNPFDDQLDRSLDFSMQQRVIKASGNLHLCDSDKIKSVSISTDQWINKHRFQDHWLGRLKSMRVNPDKFIDENFPEARLIFKPKAYGIITEDADSFAASIKPQ